jgi:protein-S-isoprenylcysteine O-methyltransferase Ste14
VIPLFGLFAYAVFGASFVAFLSFLNGWLAISVDDGPATSTAVALAIDLSLVAFFGVVHSGMARQRFKAAWTKIVPPAAERSAYVLVAALQFALICWRWRPIGDTSIYALHGAGAIVLDVVHFGGWALVFGSTFLLDHFELFGLRQAFGKSSPLQARFVTPSLYRYVRHPLYLGFLIVLWSAPTMGWGRVLLAAGLTVYVLIGVHYEERDLVRTFGDEYARYRERVPALLPISWSSKRSAAS